MPSPVTLVPPAPAVDVAARYGARLAFETDCADVAAAQSAGTVDFALLDVRAPAQFHERHVPGAVNLPRGKMTARRMAEWPQGTLFVVYCAGPHCNGADRAAAHLAGLGLPVKVMIGGITGWADEGLAFEREA
ncbi:rhodanese-like domain-containing protein [Lichenibacterium dinghuense]|uniref:rhodanese-like domain-containing protein n=1 Tax=Lichenibacterium dinghuense TaxID=2895977 RepID=UPI001F3D34E8|nr:rhodanese-like domain-containing protein [Lichenibacterium sp. 6Y81]